MHYLPPPNYQAAVSEAVQREIEAMQGNLAQNVAKAVAEAMRTQAQEELRSIQAWQKQQQASLKRLPESTTLPNTHSHSDTTENSGKVDSPSDGKERANTCQQVATAHAVPKSAIFFDRRFTVWETMGTNKRMPA